MNEQNRAHLAEIIAAVDRYLAGRSTLESVQGSLQTWMALLERDGSTPVDEIYDAEADLELIRHTRLLEEQGPAARELLEGLHRRLDTALRG